MNGYDIIIAMQKWQLERGYFLHQSDGNNCGPIACMKMMELFHAIDVEEAREVYKKKNIRRFVMDEWDRLVLHCSNNLPVTVSEKLIDGSFESCFCCIDSNVKYFLNKLPGCYLIFSFTRFQGRQTFVVLFRHVGRATAPGRKNAQRTQVWPNLEGSIKFPPPM